MTDVKQAVVNAKAFAGDTLGIRDLLLEEIKSDGDAFHITLSFQHRLPDEPIGPIALDSPSARYLRSMTSVRHAEREYKVFDVDKQTGEVTGMSIRSVE